SCGVTMTRGGPGPRTRGSGARSRVTAASRESSSDKRAAEVDVHLAALEVLVGQSGRALRNDEVRVGVVVLMEVHFPGRLEARLLQHTIGIGLEAGHFLGIRPDLGEQLRDTFGMTGHNTLRGW